MIKDEQFQGFDSSSDSDSVIVINNNEQREFVKEKLNLSEEELNNFKKKMDLTKLVFEEEVDDRWDSKNLQKKFMRRQGLSLEEGSSLGS